MQTRALVFAACLLILGEHSIFAADAPPNLSLTVSNQQNKVRWNLYPAAQQYQIRSTRDLNLNSTNDGAGTIAGNVFTKTNAAPPEFYSLTVTPISSNALLTANVLNRLAYGPTPDELERVTVIGPQAYINEQLAPEAIVEPFDTYTSVVTNGASVGPNTNWSSITITGRYTGATLLYVYMTVVGDVYVDNIAVRPMYFSNVVEVVGGNTVTNTVISYGIILLANGGFESVLTPGWTVSANLSGSSISSTVKCSGNGSLHVVSSSPGTTQASSIWRNISNSGLTNTHPLILTYDYLPSPNSSRLTIRLSGNGIISSADDEPSPAWVYVTQTGTATSSNVYIYITGIPAGAQGELYMDDVKLVPGSVPEVGPNLWRNGGFESPLLPSDYNLAPNMVGSSISTNVSHTGAGSLHLVASTFGSTFSSAIVQSNIAGMVANQTYTLSYWYWPGNYPLTVRLSQSGINSTPDASSPGLHRRLDQARGSLQDLRSWFCLNGVGSKRQLLEILTQFCENHFVTQHAKSVDYLDTYYDDFTLLGVLAADWEYREISKWRAALLRPDCTFYDLLKISCESPAMIVYLDTVDSKGNINNIANENYAREIKELFTMGVDNGYDQNDIVYQSRAWTGWSVEIVDPENVSNPFAPQSVTYVPDISSTSISNKVGVWAFHYVAANHGTNRSPIFPGKTVPARFGPPWAGRSYQLNIPARTGNSSIQDGYDVALHLANLPFTEEYISVKLCRLFIHDDFPNPTTKTDQPEYAFYDYTNPNLSAEAALVRQSMLAWENSTPKGNIRAVLATIFNSELFRAQGGSLQKVKTPLEYVLSAVRAVRSANANGTFTANSDGNFSTQLSRMGSMSLFNRDAPDGYPEAGPPWISAGTLSERLRYIQALLSSPASRPGDAGGATTDPVALLKKKLPVGSYNNPGQVADYFLSILYPAEGKANLDFHRTSAIAFLNDGSVDSPPGNNTFAALPNTSTAYDTRVRGMVSWLMTLQRFHEQ